MYSYIASRLLLCCPQTALLIPLRRNEYPTYNDDDEYEKYEPRPKIVVDADVESLKSFACEKQSPISLANETEPVIVASAQYSVQKRAVIVKVSCLANITYTAEEEQFSVRVVVEGCKSPKQQTSFIAPNRQIHFNETFSFSSVEEATIRENGIKFRVYSRKGKNRGTLKGEGRVEGPNVSFDGPQQHKISLNQINSIKSEITTGLSPSMHRMSNGSFANGDSRRSSMVDACGRFCSQPNAESPELLLSLSYEKDQNCVTIVVEKGSQIGDKNKPPDTFIKISASGEFGGEFWRSKTEILKANSEPQYDFAATVQLQRAAIDSTTLKIEVWQSVGMLRRRFQLGVISVGLNASSPDAQEHWEQMIQGQGIAVSKWHPLQPPEP